MFEVLEGGFSAAIEWGARDGDNNDCMRSFGANVWHTYSKNWFVK
jgi:hypothetical protein